MIPLDSASLGGAFLLLLGGGLFATGLRRRARHRALIARSARATGTVVSLDESTDEDGDTLYRPVVRFTDASGATREFRSATAHRPARYEVGQQVPVFYSPSDRSKAEIVGDTWLADVGMLILFFALALLGAVLIVARLTAGAGP